MSIRSVAMIAALGLLQMGCESESASPPRAYVDGETIEGAALGEGVSVFRGIPYAAPPVGDLRWRPPMRHESGGGVRPAIEFGPACPQTNSMGAFFGLIAEGYGHGADHPDIPRLGEVNEDCLYLNVWSANLSGEEPLPVMVWIHGGGNTAGSGMGAEYGSLSHEDVVVVTINYRLGVLGFLAHPALSAESEANSSGNYGLLDQIAALEWVQRNIAGFGGDPDRVTIFGESAGSSDVAYLMTSPLARGLFHRAIMQSAAPINQTRSLEAAEARGVRHAESLGLDADPQSAEAIAELRSVDCMELVRRYVELTGGSVAGPNVDGWFLTEPLREAWTAGRQADVPLMVGSMADEYTTLLPFFLPDVEHTPEGFEESVRNQYRSAAERVLDLYPAETGEDAYWARVALGSDAGFTCPSRYAAKLNSDAGRPAYLYHLTRAREGGESLGAFHGADVFYLFDMQLGFLPIDDIDRRLTGAMMGYWTNFAANGNPNGPELPEWPMYEDANKPYMDLGDEVVSGEGFRRDRCDFMDEVAGR